MVRAGARPAGCARSPCVDKKRCQACSECPPIEICPQQIIMREADSSQAVIAVIDGCYGCLACVTACPFSAVWSD